MSLDRAQDRLLPIGKLPQLRNAFGNPPDSNFIQTAGLVPAVAGDEGNRIALIEQMHRSLDVGDRHPKPLG